ncbi:hypothetical protein M501DRAFT_1034304 [Patellaria atrata CBS 101060]|uniref:CBF1-interacting co-repressor CIR N-terminal domain-containing protein n=1 Tax=Patellaria atrata CBS 101060 TaxID=1346257 RepID=A0A9P4VNF2_9PEZI|nr:hypothetical protein M501DRAFT_1034304 [Patellaria atrata CBS 101060]
MPLHLLGKKSWNVYNPDNIERVRRDEAAAAAKEAEEEQRMQEIDTARRIAFLRGQTPPPIDPPSDEKSTERKSESRRQDRFDGRDRKRRRLAGEDDTDRDIRLARSQANPSPAVDDSRKIKKHQSSDAPLTNHAGNIDLFPIQTRGRAGKNEEAEAEKKKKKREEENLYTMRLSNAAGRDGIHNPWYTSSSTKQSSKSGKEGTPHDIEVESKDVFGRPDSKRKERESTRIVLNDPLAIMQQAQSKLRDVEKERSNWEKERERELLIQKASRDTMNILIITITITITIIIVGVEVGIGPGVGIVNTVHLVWTDLEKARAVTETMKNKVTDVRIVMRDS